MNPLESSPALRRATYALCWFLGLALGGAQVGYASVDGGAPTALTVALSVYAFVASAIGYQAHTNTAVDRGDVGEDH